MRSSIQTFSGRESAELASLRSERDVDLRAAGYLRFASRMESQGREAEAAEIYQSLISEASEGAETASRRLEVLRGGGSFGSQVERLSRHLVSQATDPSLLLGMGAAGLVASVTRFGILTRLASSPAAFGTRGTAARFLAGSGALALEAPTFTLSTRFANSLLGRAQDPSLRAWGQELASGYLMLGALKLSGGLSHAASSRWLGAEASGSLGVRLFHHTSMFAGLMTAHALESRVGLREAQAFGDLAMESMATLLQLHVAGRLSHQILGPRLAGFQRQVELQSREIQRGPQRNLQKLSLGTWNSGWNPAGVGKFSEGRRSSAPEFQAPMQVWMAAVGEGGVTPPAGNGNGSGNGRSMLQRAAEVWAEWLRQDGGTRAEQGLELREATYEGEKKITEALDDCANSAKRRPVLFVKLDIPARSHWAEWGRVFLERHPHMEEIILSDSQGEGWWVGRPPLADLNHVEAHSLTSPEFRGRPRHPGLVMGLRLSDNWQRWADPAPISEYLRELRVRSGLSTSDVAARLEAVPNLKAELKSYRMNAVEARHIRYAESGRRLPVAFPLLRRLAEVYGEDVRRLILSSNQSLHPGVSRDLWATETYPIYLESRADLGRIEYFESLQAEGRSFRQDFAWLLWSSRKNPERYRTIPDLAAAHRLTQGELAVWELGQGVSVPSFQKISILSSALGMPVDRIIHAVNQTYYPELPLANLFPGQAIFIDSREHDPAFVQGYAEQPGSVGQYLFAARKRFPDRPGRSAWSREQGFHSSYLYERESNRVKILPGNLSDWTELFRHLQIPHEVFKYLAKVHGHILINSPAHLLAEGGAGGGLQALSELSGLSANTLVDVSRMRHKPRPETIRDLGEALPDLDAGRLYLRAHPELSRFYPELGKRGTGELRLSSNRLREAVQFHLGTALFSYRHDTGTSMASVAARLGVTKQTVSLYESVFVRIHNPEVLKGIADLLGADRRMLYLHYNPEILDIFPVAEEGAADPLAQGSRAFLRETNQRYDRNNLRRLLMAAMGRQKLLRGLDPNLSPVEKVSHALRVSENKAKKYLGEARILNLADIKLLRTRLPALDYSQWYGHFYRSSLVYFLGMDGEGCIDFRIPENLPLRVETSTELYEGFLEQLNSQGVVLPAAELKSLGRSIRQGGRLDSMTLARLGREYGLDRNWLYFHFRRSELAPLLEELPKP